MKVTYNINEEISRVETGDTVLICGLYGKNFKFINNKLGTVKNIVYRNNGQEVFHLAEIEVINGTTAITYTINFDFVYKLNINQIVDNVVQHVVSIDNPMLYYVHKKHIIECMNITDEMGQQMAVCIDNQGKSHALLFSGIN